MSSLPKVSVLVPCFNVEKFVHQCILSLMAQTLHEIEVIIINDGSTDATLSVIRETINNDKRFIVVDKENSGYGATMNLGLTLARGEYIGIVESDDWVQPEMFERLYKIAKKYNLDIARCHYNNFCYDGVTGTRYKFMPKNLTFDSLNYVDVFRTQPSIWAAIYRGGVIRENRIQFLNTAGAAYQDTSFAFKTLLCARRIRCIDDRLLNYRIHGGNSVCRRDNAFAMMNEFDECLKFAKKIDRMDVIEKIMLKLEYSGFRWNYRRLSDDLVHDFFVEWVFRWRKNKGYNFKIKSLDDFRFFLNYIFVTKIPFVYECYLKYKRGK